MTMIVEPGPLPENGARVEANEVLDAFVRGTRFTNFPADALDLSDVLLCSATDAPSSAARGQLFFQRGVGQLWFSERIDRDGSAYSAYKHVRLAPVREVLLMPDAPTLLGGVLDLRMSTTETMGQYYRDEVGRQTTKVSPDRSGATNLMTHFPYLAAESVSSGTPVRAVEWGFCDALFGTGASVVRGAYAKSQADGDAGGLSHYLHTRLTGVTGETNWRKVGEIAGAGPGTDVAHLVAVYKRPTSDIWWR